MDNGMGHVAHDDVAETAQCRRFYVEKGKNGNDRADDQHSLVDRFAETLTHQDAERDKGNAGEHRAREDDRSAGAQKTVKTRPVFAGTITRDESDGRNIEALPSDEQQHVHPRERQYVKAETLDAEPRSNGSRPPLVPSP